MAQKSSPAWIWPSCTYSLTTTYQLLPTTDYLLLLPPLLPPLLLLLPPLLLLLGAEEAKWGSPGFSQMGRTKASLARDLHTTSHTKEQTAHTMHRHSA